MKGAILICNIEYKQINYTTLKIRFTCCLCFCLISWSLWYYNLFKYIMFLKNKGERSLVIPQYFTGCFISKRVDKRNLLYFKMLEVIIFNQKDDMAEKNAIDTISIIQF